MNLSQSTFLLLLLLFAAAAAASSVFDYRDALTKSILYFEAQRSGHLPHNQRVSWRDHSALDDGLEEGVDLVGGYYDAGDHVKFGLPMAFTVTMLAWSAIEYGEEIHANDEYEHVLEAIKWGTDYFIKAHKKENELWVQVGDGDMDHWCWQRPEDMTTSRRAYKVDEGNPGSEVAGETAAAMAAAAIAFRGADLHYSRLLLRHSQQLFSFANKHRGRYDESVKVVRGFYPSASGYGDELLWAALWLHSATGKSEYLDFVVENGFELGGAGWAVTEFSWDIKYPGLQILAAKFLTKSGHQLEKNQVDMLNNYKSKAEHYLCACLNLNPPTANVARTPGGLLYVRRWNNMQYVTGATFLLTVYSDHLRKSDQLLHCPNGLASPDDLLSLAKSQVDYILGSNPRNMSYLVGFGSKWPERVHHRAGSIVSYKSDEEFVGCAQGYDNWFGRQMENPNVVTGALVGGPDLKDEFRDKRGNYMQTEACTYNTAPLVGLFAKLGVQPPNCYTG